MGQKIFVWSFVGVLVVIIYLIFALPKMVDPSERLNAAAKQVAGGTKSSEEAKTRIAAFNKCLREFLLKFGGDNSAMLSKRLKTCLPSSAFEVLVVDLPKGLKLVEIDTVLQATDFLIMKGTSDTRVLPLPGFEVYDDARTVNDQAGAVIVLVGHSSGQPPHRPIIQTLALLPDSVVDDTATMVPPLPGEGTAKFVKDGTDINVEVSMPSVATAEKISVNPPIAADRVIKTHLQWIVDKYVGNTDPPTDLPGRLLLLARGLKHPELAGQVALALGPEASRIVKEHGSAGLQELSVRRTEDKRKGTGYSILTAKKKIDLDIRKVGLNWQVATFAVAPLASLPSAGVTEGNPNGTAVATTSNTVANPVTTTTAATNQNAGSVQAGGKNPGGESKTNPVKATANTNNNAGKKPSEAGLLGGLTPERAGSRVETQPATGKSAGNKPSYWLDDNQEQKTAVAMVQSGSKNAAATSAKEKEKAEKLKAEKEKAEKARAEKEKAEKARAEKEKSKQTEGPGPKIAGDPNTGTVRLRSGPGLNANTIDQIPKGTRIQILGRKKDWFKVSVGGKTGYVFGQLVEGATDVAAEQPTKETGKEKKSTSKEQAKETGKKEDTHKNKTATKEDTHKGKGADESQETKAATPPPTQSSGVVVHLMTVRDDNRKAISTVKLGEHVVVLSGLKNRRYKIRKSDGTVGWVSKEALDVKVETPPEFVP